MWSPWNDFTIMRADFESITAQGITCEVYPNLFDCLSGKDFAAKHSSFTNGNCGDMVWIPEGCMIYVSTFEAPTCKRDVKLATSFVCHMPVYVKM